MLEGHMTKPMKCNFKYLNKCTNENKRFDEQTNKIKYSSFDSTCTKNIFMHIEDLIAIYKDELHKQDWASTLQRNTFFLSINTPVALAFNNNGIRVISWCRVFLTVLLIEATTRIEGAHSDISTIFCGTL